MKLVILGGGPAGYAAAATAAHFGADVTLVEDTGLGGNCTMTDAIPSKTLLTTADAMLEVERAEAAGLDFTRGFPSVNLRRTLARARAVALHQSRGVRERMDGISVRVLPGRGEITGENALRVDVADEPPHDLEFDALLICTGASPFVPAFAPVDGRRVLTTRQIFDLPDLPPHLVVLGAGPTGCEFADFFSRCGSHVTLVSSREQILPGDDPDLAEVLEEVFLRRGMDVLKGGRAAAIGDEDGDVQVLLEDGRELHCSHCLLCIGMRPNTNGLGLERTGVERGPRGELEIDGYCRTNVPHVYACGDVTGQIMLANTAAVHGRTAALHALGIPVEPFSYTGVAWCVFTRPEIAKAGISERQARAEGRSVRVTKHLIRANPRAVMEDETDGLVKLVSEPESGVLVGGAMVGIRASEVITAVALAVHAGLSVQTLAETAAVNPSMSESLQRTAEKAAEGMIAASRVTLSG